MQSLKIVVVGNCQARPIGYCLSQYNKNVTVLEPLIVHLLTNSDIKVVQHTLMEADVIVSQQLNESYHIECLRTENLRQQYGAKLVVIPNIFLTKYCPDLVYISSPDLGRLPSMLDIYHSRITFEAWSSNENIALAVSRLDDKEYWNSVYHDNVSKSISELKKRDMESDITVFDIIENVSEKDRPFFTFNHPSNQVLAAFSKRILAHINEPCTSNLNINKEPLASIIAPVFEGAKKAFDYKFDGPSYCVGFKPIINNGKVVSKGIRKIMSNRDFVECSFDLYDRILDDKNLSNIRYTPSY